MKKKYQGLISSLPLLILAAFISCSSPSGPSAPMVQRTYDESVKQVVFTGSIATIDFKDLDRNDIYLVRVNQSGSNVNAAGTGRVYNMAPNPQNDMEILADDNDINNMSANELPRMGRPADERYLYPLPEPAPVASRASNMALAVFVPPALNSTRNFWVESAFGNRNFIQKSATLLATGKYSNIWVIGNSIAKTRAQNLADRFDLIYPAETNILGYEYGGGPGGNGGMDGDPKIQILVYNILDASGNAPVAGYFWDKDYYTDANIYSRWKWRSNEAEIFYLDASEINSIPDYMYSTLIHEFQHMINFNMKYVENGKSTETWYNEMLSMMAEDLIAPMIGVSPTNNYHAIQQEIPRFLSTYYQIGVTQWLTTTTDLGRSSYSKGFAFGAYLMRNYGGAELLQKILANDTANADSITAALGEINPGMTFDKAFARYGEAMIFSGSSIPEGSMTFDKTVTKKINGFTYTATGFDIWKMNQKNGARGSVGPYIFNSAQRDMKPYSITIHSDNGWKKRSGDFSVTLEKPANNNVILYLMVK